MSSQSCIGQPSPSFEEFKTSVKDLGLVTTFSQKAFGKSGPLRLSLGLILEPRLKFFSPRG